MPDRRGWIARSSLLIGLLIALSASTGCGSEQSMADRPAVAAPPAPAAAAASKASEDPRRIEALLAIAQEDFVAGRYVSPPDANALQGFLDVRDLEPDNAKAKVALVDLFPIVVQQAEAALDAADTAEATRIIGLLERAAPDALSLAPLKERLAKPRDLDLSIGPPDPPTPDATTAPQALTADQRAASETTTDARPAQRL